MARRWQRPEAETSSDNLLKQEAKDLEAEIETLEGFLHRIRSHSFTLTAMAFQDAGNLDLERLRRCSLHVFANDRFVPFCAYYLSKQA